MFSKSKANMDEDKKENFRREIVIKGLVFASDSMCRADYRCFAHALLELWIRVLASSCF